MNLRPILTLLLASIAFVSATAALAQDKGSVRSQSRLPPLANPNDPKIGAKELFGRKTLPAAGATRVVGFYAHGCIAGAQALPINGDTWQVMRLSRNRNWAHPDMVALLERLSTKIHKDAGWPGILVGDMSQPRGGPMFTGHASHQVGPRCRHLADADAEPDIVAQRARGNVCGHDGAPRPARHRSERLDAEPSDLDPRDARAGAERNSAIFVNAAIKKALCREAKGDRSWLSKIRPMYGHDYHFHIRIKCPAGATECENPAAALGRRRLQCGRFSPTGSRIRSFIPSRSRSLRNRGRP